MKTHPKFRHLLPGVLAVGLLALIGAGPAAAKKPAEEASAACPATSAGFREDANVGATFANAGNTTTYTFVSLVNQKPVGGVPGLIKYCVYPTPSESAKTATVVAGAQGADGSAWLATKTKKNIGFVRPGGNETNVPLDGKSTVMGTATWETLPEKQTILLHVIDANVCGPETPTCFVQPGKGPICNEGNGNELAAYNSMPFGVVDCGSGGYGLEAQSSGEFGDEVKLDLSAGSTLKSMTVDFQSYACKTSGHWNTGVSDPCVTEPAGATFKVPITARIYSTSGELLATSGPTEYAIKYRPSAESPGVKCPGKANLEHEAEGLWFNSASGKCQYSIAQLVPFTSWTPSGVKLPEDVIWTVAFNTSDSGLEPQRPQPCNAEAVGCPYDSLNVGEGAFAGAPYAGEDLNSAVYFTNHVVKTFGPPNLKAETGSAERPLGEIVTGP